MLCVCSSKSIDTSSSRPRIASWIAIAVLAITPAAAQRPGDPMAPPSIPPPPPDEETRRGGDPEGWEEPDGTEEPEEDPNRRPYGDFLPESDGPWEIDLDVLARLAEMSEIYRKAATGFDTTETARKVEYRNGEAGSENVREYAYILRTTDSPDRRIAEIRNLKLKKKRDKNGGIGAEVDDAERFPPAYGWVFLFSRFHQPYFSYRDLGTRFDGFDWVRDVQFRGALPFTDGKDIRQWEGIATIDNVTNSPIQILAQPSSQTERLQQQYDRWSRSFNVIGMRTASRPVGYRCEVHFRERIRGLNYPTNLRYDTFRAVSRRHAVPWRASIRDYDDYRLFQADTREDMDAVRPTDASDAGKPAGDPPTPASASSR